MFSNSNGNTKSNGNFLSTNQQPWRTYEQNENTPYSPQTRPIASFNNMPIISSVKSIQSIQNLQQLPTKLTPLLEGENQQFMNVQSKIINLISSNQSSLHFQDQSATVMQRYPNNEIAFIGIWGAENSDKSFFYDRILNLADIKGDNFVNASLNSNSNAQLFFYERPFVKNQMRIFLLDCRGYKNANSLTKNEKNQLDILLSLCQVFILIQNQNNQDITEIGYTHLNDAFRRLYTQKKKKQQPISQISWPKSLFVLYNTTNSLKKHQKSNEHEKQLCQMFRDYNFSILHSKKTSNQQQIKTYTTITNPLDELYLKNSSIIFRQIYDKIEGKNYMNIRYNGLTVPHIASQLVYTLNQHNNLYLPKAFNKAKRSAFLSIYNRHALAYLLKMKQYIGEQKPYSTDYLLNAFQSASEATMEQYGQVQNQVAIKPSQDSLCLEYEKKLQAYIEQKQRNILAVNSKKSAKQLGNMLGTIQIQNQTNNPLQTFKRLQQSVLKTDRNFDSNAQTIAVANALKQLYTRNQNLVAGNKNKNYNQQQNQQQKQNQGEIVSYGQQVVYEDKAAQVQQKRSILKQKKAQFDQLSYQITQQNAFLRTKFQQQQQNIMSQIRNQQQKIRVMRSHLNSNLSGGNSNEELMAQQIHHQIQQLKNTYNFKINEKKALQNVLMSKTMPQAQLLQSKLITKRQQIQNLIKQSQQKMQIMRNGGPMAERRKIDVRAANIRRVNASQI